MSQCSRIGCSSSGLVGCCITFIAGQLFMLPLLPGNHPSTHQVTLSHTHTMSNAMTMMLLLLLRLRQQHTSSASPTLCLCTSCSSSPLTVSNSGRPDPPAAAVYCTSGAPEPHQKIHVTPAPLLLPITQTHTQRKAEHMQ